MHDYLVHYYEVHMHVQSYNFTGTVETLITNSNIK